MRPRLLYVDDDDDIRTIVQMTVELDGGFELTLAASGHEALATLRVGPAPDVMVFDMMMPGMDGLALLSAVRDLIPDHAPVIFMTARGRQADIESYIDAGAAGVIIKPFDPCRLCDEIRSMMT